MHVYSAKACFGTSGLDRSRLMVDSRTEKWSDVVLCWGESVTPEGVDYVFG